METFLLSSEETTFDVSLLKQINSLLIVREGTLSTFFFSFFSFLFSLSPKHSYGTQKVLSGCS